MFELLKETPAGRRGRLHTAHGIIETPFFMPVATAGAIKGVTLEDLNALGAQILLCNTYHLHLRPGEDVVADAGGLHGFIGWDKPILTDSGGFQVFSLNQLRKITDDGVEFKSHLDGSPLFLGPEESITIQHKLGADIIMCFDECPPSTAKRQDIEVAVERTLNWARKCKEVHERISSHPLPLTPPPLPGEGAGGGGRKGGGVRAKALLFGIVQGGLERDLRRKCAEELLSIGFDGYAVGGLAVGESEDEMYGVLDDVLPILPKDKPRYLMGVGRIEQMKAAVAKGIDMFDCVLPMREARHGTIYLSNGEKIRILNNGYINDHSPIDPDSPSPLSRLHKKSYLSHLLRSNERFGETIACAQNMGVTLSEMKRMRSTIESA